jgi:hypothetical protein
MVVKGTLRWRLDGLNQEHGKRKRNVRTYCIVLLCSLQIGCACACVWSGVRVWCVCGWYGEYGLSDTMLIATVLHKANILCQTFSTINDPRSGLHCIMIRANPAFAACHIARQETISPLWLRSTLRDFAKSLSPATFNQQMFNTARRVLR